MNTHTLPLVKYLRVISDLHLDGKRTWLPEEMDTDKETLLLVAGDVADTEAFDYAGYLSFFSKMDQRFAKVIYVPGNHEHCGTKFPNFIVTMKEYFHNTFGNRVLILDNELTEVITEDRTLLIAGTTLWTSFCNDNPLVTIAAARMVRDFHAIAGFSISAAQREHALALSFLDLVSRYMKGLSPEKLEKTSLIVLSHFAPLPLSGHARYLTSPVMDYFCNNLVEEMTNIANPVGQNLWVHGHTHSFADYSWTNWRVLCNPLGYNTEMSGFNGLLRISVDDLYEYTQEIIPMNADID